MTPGSLYRAIFGTPPASEAGVVRACSVNGGLDLLVLFPGRLLNRARHVDTDAPGSRLTWDTRPVAPDAVPGKLAAAAADGLEVRVTLHPVALLGGDSLTADFTTT